MEQLCNGEFCQFLAGLNLESGKNSLLALRQALRARCRDETSSNMLPMGTVAEIASRRCCPSCHFIQQIIDSCTDQELEPRTQLVASFFPLASLNFYLRCDDGSGRTTLFRSKRGESITFLGQLDLLHPSAGKIVDSNGLDYDRLKSWLALCEQLHEDVCPISAALPSRGRGLPKSLRAYDVQRNCLTEIAWEEKYVALSYVWGGAQPPRLMKDSLDAWMRPNAAQKLGLTIPLTIQDTMEVVRKIDLRYLWFDSLCLVQDNPEDLLSGIGNMDIVYERAYLTIVAANSHSADGGLPGVRNSRNVNQHIQYIKPGLSLLRRIPLDGHLNESAWATRGWTLQEANLSRRTFNFVNNQIYFRCRQRIWSEDSWDDCVPESQSSEEFSFNYLSLARESMDLREYVLAPYEFLFSALEVFQKRQITMDGDAINAMTGFLRRVAEAAQTEMVEGIPAKLLPMALIFTNHRLPSDAGMPRRRVDFPSWSWAGWAAPSVWDAWRTTGINEDENEVFNWLSNANWISWFASKSGSPPRMLHYPSTTSSTTGSAEIDSSSYADPGAKNHSFTSLKQSETIPTLPLPTKSFTVLTFSTISVRLKVLPPEKVGSWYRIEDKLSVICGELCPDTDISPEQDGCFEFIVLSERYRKPNWGKLTLDGEGYNASIANKIERDQYWIMLIERTDDVYERRGIGAMLKTSVQESFEPGPQWKEIVLG